MTKDQTLLAAVAAGVVGIVSAIMALTGEPAMWWTSFAMVLLLIVFVDRLRRHRRTTPQLGPPEERIDDSQP
jgi:Flp pilus assembly protein TadB